MTPLIDGSPGKTLAAGICFLLIAGAGRLLLGHSMALFSGNLIPGDPGPFYLGFLCLSVIAIAGGALSAIGIWAVVRGQGRFVTTPDFLSMVREWTLAGAFVASLVAMPAAMDSVGTTLAVGVFSTAWIYVLLVTLHGHALRHAVEALVFGAGTAAIVMVLFMRLLTLPLPD